LCPHSCCLDSLKPFVDVPFASEAHKFFAANGLDLLEHRARWGGAVHFALAANGGEETSKSSRQRQHGKLGAYVASKSNALVYSCLPTRSNNADVLESPSFDNTWYAVAYQWQIGGFSSAIEAAQAAGGRPKTNEPFATIFWGEPVVYRDADGQAVCVTDVCAHRSAPLSMGTVEDGELVCFYHGWRYGREGNVQMFPPFVRYPWTSLTKREKPNFETVSLMRSARSIELVWNMTG
jgi:nitrite reductase/ring-hydroxylating ferredoxin subunit